MQCVPHKIKFSVLINSGIIKICLQVFGLGNKTYEHYNKVAIYVDKRLEELGGSRVFELGLGDDDAKYVKDFVGAVHNYVMERWLNIFLLLIEIKRDIIYESTPKPFLIN